MCGRYGLELAGEELAELLELPLEACQAHSPRFNIAPTQRAPILRQGPHGHELSFLRWGLVPSGSRVDRLGSSWINARSETVQEKPSFREAFHARRCVVVADGFYEWRRAGRQRLPFHFQLQDGQAHGFAGIWESWRHPMSQEILETFSILTCPANGLVGTVHGRMPVILPIQGFSAWLDPTASAGGLQSLLRPYAAEAMESWEVSQRVNAVANDDPTCRLPALRLL